MLLDVTGHLLSEVGIERISTNLICERAGVTPPALYNYFSDKYAIMEALGRRLMERQLVAMASWMERYIVLDGFAAVAEHLEELLRVTVAVTEAEPGGLWVERAISATPSLTHIRSEARLRATEQLTDGAAKFLPGLAREEIWTRMRIAAEFGYVVGELLRDQQDDARDRIFAECARTLRYALIGWERDAPGQ